jgi:hypothetical protein
MSLNPDGVRAGCRDKCAMRLEQDLITLVSCVANLCDAVALTSRGSAWRAVARKKPTIVSLVCGSDLLDECRAYSCEVSDESAPASCTGPLGARENGTWGMTSSKLESSSCLSPRISSHPRRTHAKSNRAFACRSAFESWTGMQRLERLILSHSCSVRDLSAKCVRSTQARSSERSHSRGVWRRATIAVIVCRPATAATIAASGALGRAVAWAGA